jgi:aminopeptidase N
LEDEEKRDPSDRGKRSVAAAKASVYDADSKAKTFEEILKKKDLSYHMRASVMSGFRWWHQKDILQPYTDKYFAVLRQLFKEESKEIATAFCNALYPYDPEDKSVLTKTEELLASLGPDEKVLVRYLKEHIDDLQRARNCRSLVLSS